eukprot:261942-Chlamydomonas_euryale.AAC.1
MWGWVGGSAHHQPQAAIARLLTVTRCIRAGMPSALADARARAACSSAATLASSIGCCFAA